MTDVRAIVLCAGEGTRLRPLTHTQPKSMLPVANRPVLHWICSSLAQAGVVEIAIVLSPGQSMVPSQLGDGRELGVHLHYCYQTGPRGIAGAMLAARDFVAGAPFMVHLGDNLTGSPLAPLVDRFQTGTADGLLALRPVPDPRAFGVAMLDGERIMAVEEKPAQPRSNLAITGIYLFQPPIWDAIGQIVPSCRGELEITDAIALMLRDGRKVLGHQLESWWCDMGSVDGWLSANREVLDRLPGEVASGALVQSSRLEGRVRLGPGAVVDSSVIRGPAVIGAGCVIRHAYVGPYTAVGDGSRVIDAAVEHSILLQNATVEGVPRRLTDCILGREVIIGARGAEGGAQLVVGDHSRLNLPES